MLHPATAAHVVAAHARRPEPEPPLASDLALDVLAHLRFAHEATERALDAAVEAWQHDPSAEADEDVVVAHSLLHVTGPALAAATMLLLGDDEEPEPETLAEVEYPLAR